MSTGNNFEEKSIVTRVKRKGTILSYLRQKGFGFIKPDKGDKDIFVHRDYVKMKAGQRPALRPNMEVSFEECSSEDKVWAENVSTRDGKAIDFFSNCGPMDRTIFSPVFTGILCELNFKGRRGYVIPLKPIKLEGEQRIITKHDRLTIRFDDFICEEGARGVYLPEGYLGMKVLFQVWSTPNVLAATAIRQSDGRPFEGIEGKAERKKYTVDRAEEKILAENVDTEKVYTGLVLQCRVNAYGFILADTQFKEELRKLGRLTGQLYFSNTAINTEMRPALVLAGSKVRFNLSSRHGRIVAVNVSNENGDPIVIPHDKKPSTERRPREVLLSGKRFTGKVLYYDWDKTWGCLKVNNLDDFSKELSSQMLREGKGLYFHWKDIISTDKVIGLNGGMSVQFNVYKDRKGIGAGDLLDRDGKPFSGVERKLTARRRRVKEANPKEIGIAEHKTQG